MEPVFRLLHMPGMLKNMIEYSYRIATQNDIQAITDIYNAAVIRGGSSADIAPCTYEQRKAWVESHHDPYAVFVTETLYPACAETIAEYAGSAYPAIVPIPDSRGPRGVGVEALKKNVEKAVGMDILANS